MCVARNRAGRSATPIALSDAALSTALSTATLFDAAHPPNVDHEGELLFRPAARLAA